MATLAEIEDFDPEVLMGIESYLPTEDAPDLMSGVAAIARRNAARRLTRMDSAAERARVHIDVGRREIAASLHDFGAESFLKAAAELRQIDPAKIPNVFPELPYLASKLDYLGTTLYQLGLDKEATEATRGAVALYRDLVNVDRSRYEADLGRVLANLAGLSHPQPEERLKTGEEAVEIGRRLSEDASQSGIELAGALENYANALAEFKRHSEAQLRLEEATNIRRAQTALNPSYKEDLARLLTRYCSIVSMLGDHVKAKAAIDEACELYYELAEVDPAKYREQYWGAIATRSKTTPRDEQD